MSDCLQEYQQLVQAYEGDPDVVAGQMFGKPCLKVAGKAFLAQHKETIAFKLSGPAHAEALAQAGATLWDPSGKGRPMKEWVALRGASSRTFKSLAAAAYAYVAGAA